MKKVLCYGDSNTYGYDPRDGGRYIAEHRWVDILESDELCLINEGLNGREIPTCDYEYKYLERIVRQNLHCDMMILALGVNDAYNMRHSKADKIADRWRTTFNQVPALSEYRNLGKTIVLVAPPVGFVDGWGSDSEKNIIEALTNLPREYEKLANELSIEFADSNKWDIEMSFDGVHFSELGHKNFAKGIFEFFTN